MPFLLLYFKFIFKGNSYKKIISCRFNYHFSQLLRTSFNKKFCQKLSFFKKRIHRNTETPPQPKSTKHDESFLLMLSKLKKIFVIHSLYIHLVP